jgi:hypothetical protein
MSWLCSAALEVACSPRGCSDGERSAPLNGSLLLPQSSSSDRTMDTSSPTRSGMTFGRSTDSAGEGLLTSFLAGFPVKPIPQRLRERTLLTTSGRTCGGSWQMSLPGTSLPKTSAELRSTPLRTTSRKWVTKPARFPLPRQTWVRTTFGPGIGYLHTPTTQGNYCADSMQKHPSCRAWRTVFGKVTPEAQEWLMGWPRGWTASEPLETAKFQLWLSRHFTPWQQLKEAA